MPYRPSPAALAAVALAAATAQFLAMVALNMVPETVYERAAAEGPWIYLTLALLVGVIIWALSQARRRPVVSGAAVPLAGITIVAVAYRRVSVIGLAYHGEFLLHYFVGLLALALCGTIAWRWFRAQRLGGRRFAPAIALGLGAVVLGLGHLATLPRLHIALGNPVVLALGTGLGLLAWPLALAAFWRDLYPAPLRIASVVLLVPLLVRLALAGPMSLAGEPVPAEHVTWAATAMVLAAPVLFFLYRPKIEIWVRVGIWIICVVTCGVFAILYVNAFGNVESDLGELLRLLFGFRVPYPQYVSDLQSAAMLTALWFFGTTVYTAVVAGSERTRGVALGLMAVAGLGLGTPHRALLLIAGATLFVESLRANSGEGESLPPIVPEFADVLAEAAERLGLDAPIKLETETGEVHALRGELNGQELDLRARPRGVVADVEIHIGLIGREAPDYELVPDAGERGARPSHLLSRTHRIEGDNRLLEELGDAPLDGLTPFPTARLSVWPAGCRVDLGTDLSGLDADSLEALLRAWSRALR